MTRPYRVGDLVTLDNGYGLWSISHFDQQGNLWILPRNDDARLFAKLTVDGTVGVAQKHITHYLPERDTLL